MQLKKKNTKFSSLVETVEADHTSEDKERGVERCWAAEGEGSRRCLVAENIFNTE